MADEKMIRLSQAARELNVGISTITDKLAAKGFGTEYNQNSKITVNQFEVLATEFGVSIQNLKVGDSLQISKKFHEESATNNVVNTPVIEEVIENVEIPEIIAPIQEISLTSLEIKEITQEKEQEFEIELKADAVPILEDVVEDESKSNQIGLKIIGKIDLDTLKKANTNKNEQKPKHQDKNFQEQRKNKAFNQENKNQQNKEDLIKPKLPEADKNNTHITTDKADVSSSQTEHKKNETLPKPDAVIESKEQKEKFQKPTHDTHKHNQKQSGSNQNQFHKNKESEHTEKAYTSKPSEKHTFPKNEDKQTPKEEENPLELIEAKAETLKGLTVLGRIELPVDKNKKGGKPVASSDDKDKKKRKRKKKRVRTEGGEISPENKTTENKPKQPQTQGQGQGQNQNQNQNQNQQSNATKSTPKTADKDRNKHKGKKPQSEFTNQEIKSQVQKTLAEMSNKGGKGQRKNLRDARKSRENQEFDGEDEVKLLRVTEFISASDLASLMEASVNDVIKACLSLGMFVSINQRLDAEQITFIAAEFDYEVEFISLTEEKTLDPQEVESDENNTAGRAPIVTIMGHVDHGKTSLLDFIRRANVTASESGGITQHIGAYDVATEDGKRIVFLDTPGHEAFTAMRARGAKVTDIVILVVAADDSVMPQTKEAINHARMAGVPIVIALNKIDKPTANPAKIREELAQENILVESWGGKFQEQEISAKSGQGIPELLEKVLLEAELLELKANPERRAIGTVIEAALDKGKGYVTTILVQNGTLKIGDPILAGSHYGRVKAMVDHRGKRLKEAPPATPVQVLGLVGAPQSGDIFKVTVDEREAREIAAKREQILREQNIRATKGLTLDEIARRRLLGNFQELKIIVKGDVDGSVEALSDSLLKLSTDEFKVSIIHKAVGQISEADIMLASASEAIIVGFQVRPSVKAKQAAEHEKVQIKLYSIIYTAIEEIKDAMEGMLAPKIEEFIVGNVEVREVFKISKIGTIAGCYVTDGNVKRSNKIRVIRDGIVTYEGDISALKRFKDDVTEVKFGFECGLSIKNFNDLKIGDVIESYEQREVKRTL
jgi:translation initiation factor IF-2